MCTVFCRDNMPNWGYNFVSCNFSWPTFVYIFQSSVLVKINHLKQASVQNIGIRAPSHDLQWKCLKVFGAFSIFHAKVCLCCFLWNLMLIMLWVLSLMNHKSYGTLRVANVWSCWCPPWLRRLDSLQISQKIGKFMYIFWCSTLKWYWTPKFVFSITRIIEGCQGRLWHDFQKKLGFLLLYFLKYSTVLTRYLNVFSGSSYKKLSYEKSLRKRK